MELITLTLSNKLKGFFTMIDAVLLTSLPLTDFLGELPVYAFFNQIVVCAVKCLRLLFHPSKYLTPTLRQDFSTQKPQTRQ